MIQPRRIRPVVLCVLDGWGRREDPRDNAIAAARTPVFDRLTATCPHAVLEASERHVGLPPGQMGNSEVGHMNIGAGRVVMQDLPRIDAALDDGTLTVHPALARLIAALRRGGGTCHLLGLVSPGGVHSHQRHMAALAVAVAAAGVPVAVHAFLDGRDTPPTGGRGFMAQFEKHIAGAPRARVATISGRYYAMDRDQRRERVARAYDALVTAAAPRKANADTAIADSYAAGVSDEFVEPVVIGDYDGMKDGDGLICANFRADRVRQILTALVDPDFDGLAGATRVSFAAACGMTAYSSRLNRFLDVLMPAQGLDGVLGRVVADAGLTQLRIAETEKYAHMTFFLNGGEEAPFPGEERILVPSPKVATYDLQPEMSAPQLTDRLVAAVDGGEFDLIVVNYANADMVGHTGIFDAAVAAVEAVDACLGRLADAVAGRGGAMLVTADHGNAECMRDAESGKPHTAHTLERVPAVVVGAGPGVAALRDGSLADIAPTILDLMGLDRPREMTGRTLIRGAAAKSEGSVAQSASA